jgi:hypothetical protein
VRKWKSALLASDMMIRLSPFSALWAKAKGKAKQKDLQDKT